jgi:excisionase family DNA binding protein
MDISSTNPSQSTGRAASSNPEPLTVTVAAARKLTGLGHTTVYALIGDQTLQSVMVRGRRLIHYESIKKLLGLADAA